MEIETRVKTVMSSIFNIPVDGVTEDTSVDTVEEWDSIRQINMVLALEEEFGVEFTEEEMVEMLNLPLVVITVKEAINR